MTENKELQIHFYTVSRLGNFADAASGDLDKYLGDFSAELEKIEPAIKSALETTKLRIDTEEMQAMKGYLLIRMMEASLQIIDGRRRDNLFVLMNGLARFLVAHLDIMKQYEALANGSLVPEESVEDCTVQ